MKEYFKIGDKVIVNIDNKRCNGEIVDIKPNLDIIVSVEIENFVFELKRYDKRGYSYSYNFITESTYCRHDQYFPSVMHEDIWLKTSLYIGEELSKKEIKF